MRSTDITKNRHGAGPAAPTRQGALQRVGYKLGRALTYAGFAFQQRVIGFEVPDQPAFHDETIPRFIERMSRARRYLEFGAGASTVIAARAGVPFTTVETDPFYLAAVRRKIVSAGLADPQRQRFLHANVGITEHWGRPLFSRVTPARRARWRAYPETPWAEMAGKPDFVLVDGRFRVACALTAIKRLGQGDWELWLDDYEGREHYRTVTRFARLEQMSGATAVLRARADIDRAALDAAIDEAAIDWR